MSTLYLIRHGQAGFGQAEYDILSELGATQSQHLGGYFAKTALHLDCLYSAPRRRHRETAQNMRSGAEAAGGALPDFLPAPAFDEFPFAEILQAACKTGLAEEYAALATELGKDPLHDHRAFNRLFVASMQRWTEGTLESVESFSDFSGRVTSGLREMMKKEGRGRSIAVVTSAGAIAASLQHVLGVPNQMMLKLCLSMHNTSISELRFRDDELSLISFNTVPHLPRHDLKTFR